MLSAISDTAITPADRQSIQRFQEEFAVELKDLQSDGQQLETRTTRWEDLQFAPTTMLFGEVILGLSGAVGDEVDEALAYLTSFKFKYMPFSNATNKIRTDAAICYL